MATKTEQPEDLRYAETHEWVRVEGREAIIGISDYAQDELGDVVYLELPPQEGIGSELKAGEHFGDIESVKATSELFTPVSGKITRINKALQEHAEQINTDPYGSWMIAVEMSDPTELDRLMDAAAYTEFLAHAGH
jgi:glycine cleavage system H protein